MGDLSSVLLSLVVAGVAVFTMRFIYAYYNDIREEAEWDGYVIWVVRRLAVQKVKETAPKSWQGVRWMYEIALLDPCTLEQRELRYMAYDLLVGDPLKDDVLTYHQVLRDVDSDLDFDEGYGTAPNNIMDGMVRDVCAVGDAFYPIGTVSLVLTKDGLMASINVVAKGLGHADAKWFGQHLVTTEAFAEHFAVGLPVTQNIQKGSRT